jgi:hypothetical protein
VPFIERLFLKRTIPCIPEELIDFDGGIGNRSFPSYFNLSHRCRNLKRCIHFGRNIGS